MKKHGHYCKICGEYKANEKFTGKGMQPISAKLVLRCRLKRSLK